MKLILASDFSFLLKYGYDLTGIPKSQMKIGYITTASKVTPDNKEFFEEMKNTMRNNGYNIEEIDIEGKTKNELQNLLKDKNIIHVEGGNTFYLLKIIREVGFNEILKDMLSNGAVYIGTSAGAYIMCPTIEVSNWSANGSDKFGLEDFTALNYVPFVLKAHYEDKMESFIKEKMKTLQYPLHILKDGQGILVEDNKATFFGGQELVFNKI